MATGKDLILCFLLISTSLFLLPLPSAAHPGCPFEAIYQFGDSIADTGNFIRELPLGPLSNFAHPPYGLSYFEKPTGRCSDGLLIIDFIAQAFDLPLLNPYMDKSANFDKGVNFAVAGATALNTSFLLKHKVVPLLTGTSLEVQLGHFKTYLKSSRMQPAELASKLEKALFFMGEIGGNDLNFAFIQGQSKEEAGALVPYIIQTLKDAIRTVIDLGAVRVVVPGNFPIGCSPSYLTSFKTSSTPASYDEHKCLKGLNEFASFQNDEIKKAVEELRKEYPDAVIVYADYYTAFQYVSQNSARLGIETGSLLKACCGSGDSDYNFNITNMCGKLGVFACTNPGERLDWDGVHMTQKAHKHMADWLIRDLLPKIKCTKKSCLC